MKDFPLFPCNNGIASLILCEIPTRREAYVLVRSVFGSLEGLLQECAAFCRGAGAEKVYAGGEQEFSHYPVYAHLVERSLDRKLLPGTRAVAKRTEDPRWAEQYNERFRRVHGAKTYRTTPPDALYVYDGETLIGLGQLIDGALAAVAAIEKGRGADCVAALAEYIPSEKIRLLCAEENLPATRLYDRLGFSRDRVKRIWYELP